MARNFDIRSAASDAVACGLFPNAQEFESWYANTNRLKEGFDENPEEVLLNILNDRNSDLFLFLILLEESESTQTIDGSTDDSDTI